MKAVISYHFLVEVEDQEEAELLAEHGEQMNADMLAVELQFAGIDPDLAAEQLRSLGSTVVMLDDERG